MWLTSWAAKTLVTEIIGRNGFQSETVVMPTPIMIPPQCLAPGSGERQTSDGFTPGSPTSHYSQNQFDNPFRWQPEKCSVCQRNRCSVCAGMTVQFGMEQVFSLERNRCSVCSGIPRSRSGLVGHAPQGRDPASGSGAGCVSSSRT